MVTSHDRDHPHDAPGPLACSLEPPDPQTERRLIFGVLLNALIVVVEFVGGILTGSLALLSDAAHNLTDVFALLLSYLAHRLSRRPPSVRRTYGWHRAEVFAAVVNAATLIVIGIAIIWEAWVRLRTPPHVQVGMMLIVGAIGLVGNLAVLLGLGGHHHRDLNLRSAYLHILGDVLASVGVVVAALVMRLTGQYVWDPILSALIALGILYSSARLLHEALHILLEGVPRGIKVDDLVAALKAIPGVVDVHDLHTWSLCSNVHALSAHVVSEEAMTDAEREALVGAARHALVTRFGIAETTLQLEAVPCADFALLHAAGHSDTTHHGHHH